MRLVRKPSLWSDLIARLLFALLWTAFFVVASYMAWHRWEAISGFLIAVLTICNLIAAGLIADVIVRFARTVGHAEPIVEIDHDVLRYGDSADVHLLELHPESIAEIGMKLVGECWSKSMTDVSEYRRTVRAYSRCYEEELIRMTPAPNEPLNPTVKLQLPKSPPSEGVCWKLVVDSRLRRGGVIEHPFPLRVREAIA